MAPCASVEGPFSLPPTPLKEGGASDPCVSFPFPRMFVDSTLLGTVEVPSLGDSRLEQRRRHFAEGVGVQLRRTTATGEDRFHDAQDQSNPSCHGQLAVKPFQVSVNSAFADEAIGRYGVFGMVVKYVAHDLQFPTGQPQTVGGAGPLLFGEQRRPHQRL